MTAEENSQEAFQCSHCESLGEVSFSCFQRQQQTNDIGRIWIKNLPVGIELSGVKNLFLTVGKPTFISFNQRNNSAFVEFNTLNEAELAVRDLHCKPPYNLKVTIAGSQIQNKVNKNKDNKNTSDKFEAWDFSQKEVLKDKVQCKVEDNATTPSKKVLHVRKLLRNLNYDPSIRLRQRKLDFKTDYECVSFGRGYLFRGKTDNFIGGLQKFESTSKNSKAKDKMTFSCENCQALTTKICGRCSASYCSKACLSVSNIDHKTCNSLRYRQRDLSFFALQGSVFSHLPLKTNTLKTFLRLGSVQPDTAISQNGSSESDSDRTSDRSFSQIRFESGCTVVITTYLTMEGVFVRRIDEPSEEQFARLCNDVAVEAFKGERLEKLPEVGDIVIAKYKEDLSYYRGRVISHEEGKVNLFFVDFGNSQLTDLEDVKPLPDRLKSVQPFAVKVSLKDVTNESSPDSVNYLNTLTADRIPLIMDFDLATSKVVLTEKESKTVVNKTVNEHALPSWKRENYVFSKSGVVFYLDSIERGKLEIGSVYDLILSHFDERDFLDSDVFWVVKADTEEFLHANSQMYLRIREYCEFLKNDFYLPRENELCLAKEGGEWHRCVNLKTHKTTCCLFFLDDGRSSLVGTNNIRKMIEDFTEVPSLAVCCTLPDDPKLKGNKEELQSVAVKYLKETVGRTIESATVLKLKKDAYCLSIPQINESCRERDDV